MLKYLETLLIHFFKETYDNITKNLGMFFAAITIVTFSLFVLQLIVLIYYNMENIKQKLFSQITIHIYLKNNLNSSQVADFIYQLEKDDRILNVTLVSKNELISKIKRELNLENIGNINMGDVIYLKVKEPSLVEKVSQEIKIKKDIVKEVIYWQEYAKNIETIFNFLKKILFAIMIILSLGLILIMNNTVKMSILSRRTEIRIMNLVGATGWFIKAPLFTEIFIIIFISSMVSYYFLKIGYSYIFLNFNTNLSFLSILPVDYLIPIRNYIFVTSLIVSFIFISVTIEKYLKKLAEDE